MIRRARSRGLPTTSIPVALLTAFLAGVTSAYAGTLTVAWDPSLDPSVIGYRVYVGTTPGAYTEIYDVGNATAFSYNGAEGAHYYFAVAAYAPGPVVGPRSSEVDAWAGTGEPASFWSSVWAARATTSRLRTPGSPAARPLVESADGPQFLVDGGRRVRRITSRGLARESVLIAEGSRTLHHVAVDPTFAASGWIWVSETQSSADGRRTFAVVRYRVVRNRAGERAEIISGITLPPSGNALFAIGESGHIYLAIPGSRQSSQPYWGMVLRFNPDGLVPDSQLPGSPVIGTGYTFPHAITLERVSERVLLSGAD